MRQFSARNSTKNPTATSANSGKACDQTAADSPAYMADKDKACACRASAASPTSSAGSANVANCTSRLAPMPSKLEPVSSAASTVKNRPNPSR